MKDKLVKVYMTKEPYDTIVIPKLDIYIDVMCGSKVSISPENRLMNVYRDGAISKVLRNQFLEELHHETFIEIEMNSLKNIIEILKINYTLGFDILLSYYDKKYVK